MANKCRWDFAEGTVHIGHRLVHAQKLRPTQVDATRHVFVSEEVTMLLRHEATVPVGLRLIIDNIRCPSSNWAVKPQIVQPGVIAILTLMTDNSKETVTRECGYSMCFK